MTALRKTFLVTAIISLSCSLLVPKSSITTPSEEEITLTLTQAETEAPTETQTPEPTATQERGLICVIIPREHPFFFSIRDSAVGKAEELGYETLAFIHNEDVDRQMEQIETCIEKNAAAIILDNANLDSSAIGIQKAKDAGIPTFLVDREIDTEGVAVSQIIINNYTAHIP